MLKIFKNKNDTIFNEKEELINSYYHRAKGVCCEYYDTFYKYILDKEKQQQLIKTIKDLTDIKNRIEELEKMED